MTRLRCEQAMPECGAHRSLCEQRLMKSSDCRRQGDQGRGAKRGNATPCGVDSSAFEVGKPQSKVSSVCKILPWPSQAPDTHQWVGDGIV
ncbi:hypothetical protein NDU88_005806 [Pleurodeles waltl]|uniref:Uncharacterized protein n=1 Tax=Pleurodeles waltl TaxID=8319 RepID=A0AAV7NRF0_PLEWA|nr:hypothetical protein NDU88_005806 [Pleurodeles waltl]